MDMPEESGPNVVFVSLGMFIIDTIITPTGDTLENIIGGAGTYAAIGSRLFTRPGETGFIVDYGNDVPSSVESTIKSLGLALLERRDDGRKCTRGLNTYRGTIRHFEYFTPKIRLSPSQLPPLYLRSKSFHFICSPTRCVEQVQELHRLRAEAGCLANSMISIWEPVPDSCIPANKAAFIEAVKKVDLVSPNADEAAGLLSYTLRPDDVGQVQDMAEELRSLGAQVVIIRCAALGAYLSSPALSKWYPSYITDQSQVIDATGAGNTFCGALVTLLAQGKSLDVAMCGATVAAGLCIMQTGLPTLSQHDADDLWNGQVVADLVEGYMRRDKSTK